MTMPGHSVQRRAAPDPSPIIDFGVPYMFDIQTELHLRRAECDADAAQNTGPTICAIVIAADLAILSLLIAALF
jgi:hypothetical protein